MEAGKTDPAVHPAWQAAQWAVLGVGVFIVVMLAFVPALGLHLLWNVLIPVAPLLLALAPGIWRNVCPMATVSMLPRKLGYSEQTRVSHLTQGRLLLGAVALLVVIVPLRKVVLDQIGLATAITLATVALMSAVLGLVFNSKAAWCSGLCPVYPVEMLYGSRPLLRTPNTQCGLCTHCVAPCRDSHPEITPMTANRTPPGRIAGLLLTGGFPGFVLGWFLVPSLPFTKAVANLHVAYGYPLLGMGISLLAYWLLRDWLRADRQRLATLFAAAAIAIYYWFKLPDILGLGARGSSTIPPLHGVLPAWLVWVLRVAEIGFFGWFFLLREPRPMGWQVRPPFAPSEDRAPAAAVPASTPAPALSGAPPAP
ncbi:MAG: hypothetical protein IT463_10555 [Planctomycetes bacterium]|nr:hypothetical protein [Planctomycetota bacterium]